MKRSIPKSGFRLAVVAALVASAPLARAGVGGTLELGVGTAYTRALGAVSAPMPSLQHATGAGGALRLDVGWRLDRRILVGCYHEGSRFAGGHAAGSGDVTGAAAGVQGQLHAAPSARLDPWIGVGFGWRGLWLDHGSGTHAVQGLDLARLQVGVDYRVSPRLSLAPTVGLSLTEFLWEKAPGASEYTALDGRKPSTFVFAGLSGRMDVLGRAARAR